MKKIWTHSLSSNSNSKLNLCQIVIFSKVPNIRATNIVYFIRFKCQQILHLIFSSSQANCDDLNFIEEKTAFKKFIKDLSGQKNFKWFAIMNLIQVGIYHVHWCNNTVETLLMGSWNDRTPVFMGHFLAVLIKLPWSRFPTVRVNDLNFTKGLSWFPYNLFIIK